MHLPNYTSVWTSHLKLSLRMYSIGSSCSKVNGICLGKIYDRADWSLTQQFVLGGQFPQSSRNSIKRKHPVKMSLWILTNFFCFVTGYFCMWGKGPSKHPRCTDPWMAGSFAPKGSNDKFWIGFYLTGSFYWNYASMNPFEFPCFSGMSLFKLALRSGKEKARSMKPRLAQVAGRGYAPRGRVSLPNGSSEKEERNFWNVGSPTSLFFLVTSLTFPMGISL